jgi:hypothetical protein
MFLFRSNAIQRMVVGGLLSTPALHEKTVLPNSLTPRLFLSCVFGSCVYSLVGRLCYLP